MPTYDLASQRMELTALWGNLDVYSDREKKVIIITEKCKQTVSSIQQTIYVNFPTVSKMTLSY